jgi:hypothetical protein
MKLTERLNILIQAITLSQKSGGLSLDEAVKAKSAIDIISSGKLNRNFTSAVNILIEIILSSQKKGVYTLKDAHMLYIAIEGIEVEFQNEINIINGMSVSQESEIQPQQDINNNETVVNIPSVTIQV